MTKRRNPSPYQHRPSAFVRALMTRGWRRCDAEALAIVAFCLERARDMDSASLPTLAGYAAAALAKEPVLAGSVLLMARQPNTAEAARRLWAVLSPSERTPLARLLAVARDLETAAIWEAECDMEQAVGLLRP